jgi:hypothetical protein
MSNSVTFTIPLHITVTIGQPVLLRNCGVCGCQYEDHDQRSNFPMCKSCQTIRQPYIPPPEHIPVAEPEQPEPPPEPRQRTVLQRPYLTDNKVPWKEEGF